MSDKEISLGRLFVQEAVRAGTWGLIFLVVMGMLLTSLKQEIKEGIAYSVDRAVMRTVAVATNPYLMGKAKQLGKKGIEYTLTKAAKEVRGILEEDVSRPGPEKWQGK